MPPELPPVAGRTDPTAPYPRIKRHFGRTSSVGLQWELARPFVAAAHRGSGRQRQVDLREVLNAVFSVLGTGCPWRALPKDLPPRSTVHDDFVRWQCDGTLGRLHHALYEQAREMAGKRPAPRRPLWTARA